MRRALLLLGAMLSVSIPAQAQNFEKYRSCKSNVENMDYKRQYNVGKFHAQAFQTALNRKDWDPEDKQYVDLSDLSSRHGTGGMTSRAVVLIGMLDAKFNNKKYSASSDWSLCLLGQFAIYENQAWSAVHSGFTDHLSPELKTLYFSLPTQ